MKNFIMSLALATLAAAPAAGQLPSDRFSRQEAACCASVVSRVRVGDTVFPANQDIRAGFDSKIIRATIGNRFYNTENFEIEAALGVRGADCSIFAEGKDGGSVQTGLFQRETRSVLMHFQGSGFSLPGSLRRA